MATAVFEYMEKSDIIVKSAAVSDYRVIDQAKHKIKKEKDEMVIAFVRNQDILKELGQKKKDRILVGFAAETENLAKNSLKKLTEKNLDIIVGNLIGRPDSGFKTDTNKVTLFYKDGTREPLDVMDKEDIANILFDRILLNAGSV